MWTLCAFQVRTERQRQALRGSLAGQQVVLRGEEAHVPLHQRDRAARLVEHHAVRADIADARLVDRARLRHRLAAAPQLDDARVTGCGHRSRTEVGAEEHRVFVQPGDG